MTGDLIVAHRILLFTVAYEMLVAKQSPAIPTSSRPERTTLPTG